MVEAIDYINSPENIKRKKDNTIRIAVLGATNVGKTQIINRLVNNSFSPYYEPTEGVDTYRMVYDTVGDYSAQDYRMVELIDMFPIDHQYLHLVNPRFPEDEVTLF